MTNFNKQVKRYFEGVKEIEEAIEAIQSICETINTKLDNLI
jgi:hypothetical protein